ncbi:MAG: HAMP domain-containing histidine kinase [Candidatus Heimdallarchaeota archaeon]|nr:MAG: HAMP domain-containing histidine kinase [Candidatus Heimdallarchaeota archaeon]
MSDLDINFRDLFKGSPLSIWKEDLSDLKKYLDSLKNKTDNIRKYFDENPSEVMKCAQLVKVFDVNESMMELIEEESKNELLGPLLKHMGLPFQVPPFKEAVIDLAEGNLQSFVEGYTLTKKGKLIYLKYLTYIPEKFASTWGEAWVLVFDLTEYKAKESILDEKVSTNEFLIDIVTHDLRNYIAQCQGYIDIILVGKVNQHEHVLNYLSKAKKGIQQATKLLENVSVLMKTQISKEFVLHPIELITVLIKAKEFLMNLYPNQEIVVSIENIPNNLMILADSLVEYLFINLFTNAVKHNQNEFKQIIVTSSQDDGVCSIKITDNARGIPPKMRKDIFTRYSEFQKNGKGSGLGMFISKTLVDRYDGQISIESRYPDDFSKGTQINIILKCISD